VREPAAVKGTLIHYVGFGNVEGRRGYEIDVQRGLEKRRYTVWIELAAFARGQALLQDGPDICYQKLLRELASAEGQVPGGGIDVTERDLAAYRESHAPPARRSFSPSPRPSVPGSMPSAGTGEKAR
jgi:hypothetical protein